MKFAVSIFCMCIFAVSAQAHEQAEQPVSTTAAPLKTRTQIDLSNPPRNVAGPTCTLTLRLTDAANRMPVHGLVRISTSDGHVVALEGLLSRATALSPDSVGDSSFAHMNSWSILPGEAALHLPRTQITVEYFRGLESHHGVRTFDLSGKVRDEQELILEPLNPDRSRNWHAGNTHLHLQRMTLEEAENYACQTAAADGYDIVFFSYLERAKADENYISNRFTTADLARFSERSGILFGYGEEYRHNLVGHGEGYGHVMFLDFPELILPASLGQSITKAGNDDVTLRPGIEAARAQDATVLWCHGSRGMEDIPSWLAGLLDVQMMFEQGSLGAYEEALYRYWDLGLKVPLATGTDWFFRDKATVYAQSEEPLSPATWLQAVREGRSYITNGPLIEFTVNGQPLGSTLNIKRGESISCRATAYSAYDFGELQVVKNGQVTSVPALPRGDGYFAELAEEYRPTESLWLAARVKPFEAHYDKPEPPVAYFNAYGKPLFAHTSPVYVTIDDEPIFQAEAAHALIREVQNSQAILLENGDFSSHEEREHVLKIYDEAISELERRLEEK